MELPSPSFPLMLTILFLLLVLIRSTAFCRRSGGKNQSGPKLPPSPWKLPIIGHLHHLIKGPLLHHTLRDLATKHGPVIHLKLGQTDTIVITSAEAAREVMSTQDRNFASRPKRLFSSIMSYGYQDIVVAPYGPYWRQLRKICVLELLSPTRVKALRAVREEEVCNLVEQISASCGSPVNLSSKIASLANRILWRSAVGKECRHAERLASMVKEAVGLAATMSLDDFFPSTVSSIAAALSPTKARLERYHRQIDELLDQIIEEHREQVHGSRRDDQDDLVDVLLKRKERGDAEQGFPLTMNRIKAVIFDMFLAGTEAVTTTLEWAMSELIRHPEVMKKVQSEVREAAKGRRNVDEEDLEEMHTLKLAIKETLRLHIPGPFVAPRLCAETCEIGGYLIPGGTRVLINAWAIARDPRYWEDPESFRPERFAGSSAVNFVGGSFEYLPFGAGRRMCPGIGFGMACIELALAQLLFHFDWELPDGMRPDELDMAETLKIAATRKSELRLVATSRLP